MERTLQLTELPHPWLAQLAQQHLSPKDRLSLFSASTACAREVLQHSRKQSWFSTPTPHAPPHTLQQLVAATAQHLAVVYTRAVFPEGLAAATKQLQVDGDTAKMGHLPWQRMAQLQVVTLGPARLGSDTLKGLCKAVQQGHLPQLHSLDVQFSGVGKSEAGLAARTLGPRLTSLSVRDVQPFMKHFSHFTRLTTLTLGNADAHWLTDSDYAQLASHPSLQHVRFISGHGGRVWPVDCRVCPTWPKLSIIRSQVWYLNHPWMQQAGQVVLAGAVFVGLGTIEMDTNEAGHARVLATLQGLGDCLRLESASADEPLKLYVRTGRCESSKLLMAHLAQHIHAEHVGIMHADLSAAHVAALISNLAHTVQEVKFDDCECRERPVAEVLALLPTHVTRLVFAGWDSEWVELLEGLLALPQHISLCTVVIDQRESVGRAAAAVLQGLAIRRVVVVRQAAGA